MTTRVHPARRAIFSSNPWSAAAWGALGILAGLLLFSAWQGPDIFFHLALGRAIVDTGRPDPAETLLGRQLSYLNYHWLFQVVVWGVHAVGKAIGVALFFFLLWMGTLALWVRTARLADRPGIGLPLALGAILVLWNRFEPRPEVASYLLLAALIHLLTRRDFTRKLRWLELAVILILQVAWTNAHTYFVFGPALAAGFVLTQFLRGERGPDLNEPLKILLVTAAGSLLTPYGPKLWPFVLQLAAFQREMQDTIAELRAPVGEVLRLWTVRLFWVYWGATALHLLWVTARRRGAAAFPALLAVAGLYLGATSSRNLPLFLLLAGPSWGMSLAPTSARRGEGDAPDRVRADRALRPVPAVVTLLALGLCAWVIHGGFFRVLGSPARLGPGVQPHAAPIRFDAWLQANPMAGLRVFNGSSEGAYLEFTHPENRSYADSRNVEVAFAREYFSALRDPATFSAIDQRIGFDAALLGLQESAPLITALMVTPNWRLAYADPHRAFLVRRGGPGEAAIFGPAGGDASAGPAGTSAPPHLLFYAGDDLTEAVNGRPAIEWMVLCVRTKRKELVREALHQFSSAPRVPSFVVQYGLGYGLQERDRELVDLARGMVPRMDARTAQDRGIVERLVAQARAAYGG